MASNTQIVEERRRMRRRKAGRKRKALSARKSTLSYAELFAPLGDPGQPAPKPRSS